ncbi:tRNA (5-methylaminomethyl-2-thiouridine)(34)-methyltransferase MnmD [Caulobacter sp. KR2-114]|uniref:tRNA (5-methylaminomethyl-2-thiouridine)(34)-methyltransferase MnmD n=1 Tax=Caulobacter sp. KR2-114 TaxID=3400912 RepID=UPI003C0336FE
MPDPADPAAPLQDGPTLEWDEAGQPRSRAFGDVYFSKDGGLEESRAVFLAGCGLPDAWAGRRRFCIAELGFGTGLNIAAALELWRRTRPEGAHLSLFSVEAHPLTADEARRALAHWPQLATPVDSLIRRWPGRARGFHRVDLPELSATLDVAVMDAAAALEAWDGRADAWFLDGFAPALNPGMWGEDLLRLVAARSASGARAATYTVAGAVRRGLAAAGFAVARQPGFGRKRERLEARAPGAPPIDAPTPRVAIVGAGIAGAALARAFRAAGVEAMVFDAEGPGAGASGNPAALVTPRLDAGLGAPAALFAQAFARAVTLYEALDAEAGGAVVIDRGVLQLEGAERDHRRFAAIAGADLFEPGRLAPLSPEATSDRLGEPAPGALDLSQALVVAPAVVLPAWLGEVRRARVARLTRAPDGWRLEDAHGASLADVDVVCLAAGLDSAGLAPALPALQAVRGQASWTRDGQACAPAAFGAYAIPTGEGVLFGATHDRDDIDRSLRAADHDRNLAAVGRTLPQLAARLSGAPLDGRAAIRATTRDRLPHAGALDGPAGLPAGQFVLTGLGSRGFAMAPLLAEHVAAQALGLPSPLPAPLARLVAPGR